LVGVPRDSELTDAASGVERGAHGRVPRSLDVGTEQHPPSIEERARRILRGERKTGIERVVERVQRGLWILAAAEQVPCAEQVELREDLIVLDVVFVEIEAWPRLG